MYNPILIMQLAGSSSQSQMIFRWKWQNSTEVNEVLSIYIGQALSDQHLLLLFAL